MHKRNLSEGLCSGSYTLMLDKNLSILQFVPQARFRPAIDISRVFGSASASVPRGAELSQVANTASAAEECHIQYC